MSRIITKKNFTEQVLGKRNLVLVEFKREWSGTSQIISSIYHDLEKSYNGVVDFFSVDIEKENGLDVEYGVMEIPTILFFRRGRVIDHAVGLTPKNVLISKIEKAISDN